MNRGAPRSFFGFPAQANQQIQVVQTSQLLNAEKNDLLGIMSQYLTKKKDKAQTIAQLTSLEVKIMSS
jgi:hypothetical protein